MTSSDFNLLSWLRILVKKSNTATISIAIFAHVLLSYSLLTLSGETKLVESVVRFIYFCAVVYSTTGFGDFSPVTDAGMMVLTFWMIPFGIGLYGVIIAKGVEFIVSIRQKELKGDIVVETKDHIVVLGWNEKTRKIIELTLADDHREPRKIVLAVTDEIENPYMDQKMVEFVKLDSYTNDDCLSRANLKDAAKVIINGNSDDENFVIGVHLSGLNSNIHISTFFVDESRAKSLQRINKNIECSCDRTAEMLTRTMQDHGSSVTMTKLMDMRDDGTALVLEHDFIKQSNVGRVRDVMWKENQATLIGIATDQTGSDLKMIPSDEIELSGKVYLHYISKNRIKNLDI